MKALITGLGRKYMSEIDTGKPAKFGKEFISPAHCGCCYIHITAFPPENLALDYGELFIGTLGWTDDSYWVSWRGKLRKMWWAWKNKCYGDIEIYDRKNAELFMKDLQNAIDCAFPKGDEEDEH